MPTLLIAYDLAEPAITSAPLAQAIMRLGTRWARPLASLWVVETDATAGDVEALLAPLLAADDGLLVQLAAGEVAVSNTMLRWSGRRLTAAEMVQAPCGTWQAMAERAVAAGPAHLPISPTRVAAAA